MDWRYLYIFSNWKMFVPLSYWFESHQFGTALVPSSNSFRFDCWYSAIESVYQYWVSLTFAGYLLCRHSHNLNVPGVMSLSSAYHGLRETHEQPWYYKLKRLFHQNFSDTCCLVVVLRTVYIPVFCSITTLCRLWQKHIHDRISRVWSKCSLIWYVFQECINNLNRKL